jgi:hypothetical protein
MENSVAFAVSDFGIGDVFFNGDQLLADWECLAYMKKTYMKISLIQLIPYYSLYPLVITLHSQITCLF